MAREIFIVRNTTESDLELKTFGLIISSGQTIELGNYDDAVLSDELFTYIQDGSLVRLINDVIVDSGSSYYQSTEPYSIAYNNIISVSKTGGTFTTIQSAIDSISGATSTNPYLISVNEGIYYEDIILKNYVTIQGRPSVTKIFGSVTSNISTIGNTKIIEFEIESLNKPAVYINTHAYNFTFLYDVTLISKWDNNSPVQSVIEMISGQIHIMSKTILSLYNMDISSTDNYIDTIYYIHGTSKVHLVSLFTSNMLYQYNNTNVTSLYYNTNTNTTTNRSIINDGNIMIILGGTLPTNIVKDVIHSGSTSITTLSNYYFNLTSTNDISNVVYMPCYNNYSIPHNVSGTTLGSEIFMSFCTVTWDQVKIPDGVVFLGAAVNEIDYVELMSFIFDTNFDVIPTTYDVDGISSGLTIDVTNSWGSYLNNSSIKTLSLEVGDTSAVIDNISTDSGLTDNSDNILVTQRAIKSYVDNATSGQSGNSYVLKVDYNIYTGETDIRLGTIEDNITAISGDTTNKLDKSIFNTYTGITGLQEITEINASTTIESTFNGGIVTSKIRPSGDTTTAFQITTSGGTPIINIDTNSGLTGFGTVNQKGLVHVYGINTGGGIDSSFTQTNALIVDGVDGADKDVNWSENGVPMWLADTYRNEKSKFWYLYNVSADNVSISVSENGRVGFNKQPNTMNIHSSFMGVYGLNDMYVTGVYDQNYNAVYEIIIHSTGSTDTVKWRKSLDGAKTFGGYSTPTSITISNIIIESGIEVYFDNISGHTVGSVWQFGGFTQLPNASFTVAPIGFKEVLSTDDYTSPTVVYNDITALVNGGTNNNFNFLKTGSTTQCIYIGNYIQLDSIYISLSTVGLDIILITEYWDGDSWVSLTNLDNNYIDGTENLTKSGVILWTPSTMTNWVTNSLPDSTVGEFYWIRFRTASNPTVAPIVNSLSIGTDKRFSVYSSYNNYSPNFFVDSVGRTSIGGSNITGRNLLQVGTTLNTNESEFQSMVQFDSDDYTNSGFRLRLSQENDKAFYLGFAKNRGIPSNPEPVQTGDKIGNILWGAPVDNISTGVLLADIGVVYTGDGVTKYGDLIFKTHSNISSPLPTEVVRISGKGNTGFGNVNNPTAIIHITSGTTSVAPLKFTDGNLLSTPEDGAVEYYNGKLYLTNLSGRSELGGNLSLQQVTEIGASTTVESIFNGGIITNIIKSSGDTSISISNSGGTPIITVDTISGFTGFKTNSPSGLIHAFGSDDSDVDNFWGLQSNSLIVDGIATGDKDIVWSDSGVPKWAAEIFRNENGKFWYLYNSEGQLDNLTIAETGQVGINTPTNIMEYHTIIISGSNEGFEISGMYDKTFIDIYQVRISNNVSNPNEYQWRLSKDLGYNYGSWSNATGCTLDSVLVDSGIYFNFVQITGYTLYDSWQFTAFPQTPQGTLIVNPNFISEVIWTPDYQGSPIIYDDITSIINNPLVGETTNVFNTGTTSNSIYFGTLTKTTSLFFDVKVGGVGVTLITEYWNGSHWEDISIGNSYYNDNTNNLTYSGNISWNITSDWVKSYPQDHEEEEGYFLYWLRLRTVSSPSVSPILNGVVRGGNIRFGTMSAPFDARPSFFVDALGRTSIGGGNITGRNVLQISKSFNIPPATSLPSLVEIDSEDSGAIDLRIKLASNDSIGGGLNIGKSRGTLSVALPVEYGDVIGHITFRGISTSLGFTASDIRSIYYGDSTTKNSDLIFYTSNSTTLLEKVRMNGTGTGFGGILPTAQIHITSGSTVANTAPLKFTSGSLMSSPEIGAIEFLNDAWYGTITTGSERKTFAFLDSPQFTGTPNLPSGTTIYSSGTLYDLIIYSGGTNNTTLVKVSTFNTYTGNTTSDINNRLLISTFNTFTGTTLPNNYVSLSTYNTYTGSTIPWSQVSKSGSSIADITTRNSSDITYTNIYWNVIDVKTALDSITDNIENSVGTGRLSPITVLGGLNGKTLWVSGGTGFINYQDYHRTIIWSETSYDLTSYSANTYYVYVSNDSNINISTTEPDKNQNIYLGQFYYDSFFILTISQSSNISDRSIPRLTDYTIRMGGFIYDNGGVIYATGTTQHIVSTACKVQYGLLDYNLSEINTYTNPTFTSSGVYQSSDLGITVDYYFLLGYTGNGKVINNRYNIPTNPSDYKLTGHTLTFTQYSNTVTSTSNLTGLITDDHYIYLVNSAYMTPVSSVTWSGSLTTIILEDIYLGPSGTGVTSIDKCLPKLPSGKWVKHLVLRTTSDNMAIIYGQEYFDTQDLALVGGIPSIPVTLNNIAIKMATIVVSSGITDYSQTNVITDIRPLPFTYASAGGGTGGGGATSHSSLTGLGNDDHPQYLLTNGGRSITGIISYDSHKTFTSDTNLVDKKYVDDSLLLKLNITDFNTYTGSTALDINSRLLSSTFGTFTGTTLPVNYLTINNFNTFTGTTLPTNYYTKTQVDDKLTGYTSLTVFNNYTGSTSTDINSRLLISSFNTFTGTTLPSNYVSLSTYNTYTGNTQSALNLKANLTSPAFSGTPTSTTAAVDTSSLQIATTAFVLGQASATNPLMNGSVSIGTSLRYARQDHVHDSDTSRVDFTTFNIFTGTTLPNNYYNKTQVDTILTGYTSNSTFNTFTGTTLPSNYVGLSTYNTFTGNTNTTLLSKSNLTSPSFSGTPTSTTAAADTNSIQIATTAYVVGQAANTNPLMNGSVAIGTSLRYARQDHIHASDTSKVNLTDYNTFTGVTLPTNYYTKPLTDAQFIKGTAVDATNISDGRSLVYDLSSGKIIYKTVLDSPPTVQARRTTTLVVPNTWTTVTFNLTDIENKPDSAYHDDINTDRIYVINSGLYEIKFIAQSNATSTTKLDARVLLNGTTGISGGTSLSSTYLGDIHLMYINTITYLSGGSYIIAQVLSTVNNGSTLSGDTKMIVTKLDGVVGAQGATGAGSNVIVKKGDVNLSNTPHSSLNFTGGISAVDGGSGVATISTSVYGTEFNYAVESGSTTMTGTTYLTKLSLVTSVLSGGTYRITVSYGVNKGVVTTDILSRVTVDGALIGFAQNYELSDTASFLYTTRVFFGNLSAASHTILLQFTNETSGTITMRDCSIELIRVL